MPNPPPLDYQTTELRGIMEVLICLQALVDELRSKNQLYDAHRVSSAIHLIREQAEEVRRQRGEVDRRAMRRYEQPQELSEYVRSQILSLTN